MDLLKRIEELENKMNFLIQRQGEQQQQFYRMQEARQHEFRQFQESHQYKRLYLFSRIWTGSDYLGGAEIGYL